MGVQSVPQQPPAPTEPVPLSLGGAPNPFAFEPASGTFNSSANAPHSAQSARNDLFDLPLSTRRPMPPFPIPPNGMDKNCGLETKLEGALKKLLFEKGLGVPMGGPVQEAPQEDGPEVRLLTLIIVFANPNRREWLTTLFILHANVFYLVELLLLNDIG